MSEKKETIADIVAEIREFSEVWALTENEAKRFADRIEAAYNREHHCEKRYDKDGDEMPPHCAFDDLKLDRLQGKVKELEAQIGHVAKMREALEALMANIEMRSSAFGLNVIVDTKTFLDAKAALSAPPRNCDVGTAEEQARRFHAFCRLNRTFYTDCSDGCPFKDAPDINHCQSGWGQLQYTEEAK